MGRLTGGDPSLLRRINSAVVLHALRAADSPTLTDLVKVTGLSRPTVEGVIEGLTESGLVVEAEVDGTAARRQGRPTRRFRFRVEAGHLLGIEIGPHRIAALLADLGGRVTGSASVEVCATAPADERLDQVRAAVADLLKRAGVARSSLRAVGVASPGIVEADGTVRLGTALPGWTGLPLGERLQRSFRCPVLVENDANAAAVAEHWKGAAVGSDDVVFVLAGLSPGAGSLIGGGCTGGVRGRGRGDRRTAPAGPGGHSGGGAVHHRGAAAPARRGPGGPSVRAGRARATSGRGPRWSGICGGWCTTWRRWCWRWTRSWWWWAAGRRA
ncbi:hypothetical protein GCM10020000_09380 [Streptomyces olivoverticillatus]